MGAAKKTPKRKTQPAAEETAPDLTPPTKNATPLAGLLHRLHFKHAKSVHLAEQQRIAHGYLRATDQAAVVLSYADHGVWIGQQWQLTRPGSPEPATGKTVTQFQTALQRMERPVLAELPGHVVSAVRILRRLTSFDFNLRLLAGDANYQPRVRLLKMLLQTQKVLVKDSTLSALTKAFMQAVGAATQDELRAKCEVIVRAAGNLETKLKQQSDRERRAHLKQEAAEHPVIDGKPILPGKPLTRPQRKKKDAVDRAVLAAQLAHKARTAEEEPAIAMPRPGARVTLCMEDVCLLEDPANGIVLLRLEKPNSQGAICVYNNGSRVAAGVVSPESLARLRTLPSSDLAQAANQLLSPLNASVVVTPVAHSHLTAVLEYCKEITMAENKKKFAAPVKTAAKATKPVADKPVAEAKTSAKKTTEKAAPRGRAPMADDTAIKVITKEEQPYREGTKAANSWTLLKKSATLGDFRKALEKAKTEVYEAVYFAKWASQPHGKAPAYIKLG